MTYNSIIICGPTATGKSDLAEFLATCFSVPIINMDSRQVYKDLPIVSGAEKSFGTQYLSPDQSPNVSQFTTDAWQFANANSKDGILPIVVGGTGLYLKAFATPLSDIAKKYNSKLRLDLSGKDISELQKILLELDPACLDNMNHSDFNNPRRLIRKIEIRQDKTSSPLPYLFLQKSTSFYWIGLKCDPPILNQKIHDRVIKRLEKGALNEVGRLMEKYPDRSLPIYTTLGVGFIIAYLHKQIGKDELISRWTASEVSYAKRQLLWFRKQPSIIWYDISVAQNYILKNIKL